MAKSVTLITQDFYPLKGGISTYLMQIYKKYFTSERFQVIIPNHLGKKTDYQHLQFDTYRTDFFPFEFRTSSRRQANKNILDILRKTETDIVLFGYLRSHPEVGKEYKRYNPSAKIGIVTHAKEVFLDEAIVKNTHSLTGLHKGYTQNEAAFYKDKLQDADYVFCISQFTQNLLNRQNINAKVHLLPPSLSTPFLKDKITCKLALNHSPDDFVVLSVGRLIDRKGQHKLLELIPSLKTKIPNLHYNIVGNGPNKAHLKQMIRVNNLEKIVHLYENADDNALDLHYNAADIFVLPTDFIKPNDIEGLGIVFLEAGMYQVPTIGGNSGGVSEAIVNGETGYIINPQSQEELESKIIKLFNSPQLRDKLGRQARMRTINRFNDSPSIGLINLFS